MMSEKRNTKPQVDTEIAIDHGIEMPPRWRYPWLEMRVGDSFFVPNRTSGQLSGSWSWVKKTTDARFSARMVEGGVRVWRIK